MYEYAKLTFSLGETYHACKNTVPNLCSKVTATHCAPRCRWLHTTRLPRFALPCSTKHCSRCGSASLLMRIAVTRDVITLLGRFALRNPSSTPYRLASDHFRCSSEFVSLPTDVMSHAYRSHYSPFISRSAHVEEKWVLCFGIVLCTCVSVISTFRRNVLRPFLPDGDTCLSSYTASHFRIHSTNELYVCCARSDATEMCLRWVLCLAFAFNSSCTFMSWNAGEAVSVCRSVTEDLPERVAGPVILTFSYCPHTHPLKPLCILQTLVSCRYLPRRANGALVQILTTCPLSTDCQ